MKKKLLVFFLLSLPVLLFAEADLYGNYEAGVTAVINEDDFDSPLNPGNAAGLGDLMLIHNLKLKASADTTQAALELWAGLSQQLNPQTGEIDPLLNSVNLQRAGISWYPLDILTVKLGRISMLTGYGYGWNPIDFANPLKDPADPDAELKGVDSLLVHLLPYAPVNLKIYTLLEGAETGLEYSELQTGAELSVSLPFTEFKLTACYEHDDEAGEDDRVSAAGAGIFIDIFGLGIYGEAAVLDGSRSLFADKTGAVYRKDEVLFNALGGLEYTFGTGLSMTAEYYYNGEGFDQKESETWTDALDNALLYLGTAPAEEQAPAAAAYSGLAEAYRQGNYSRHYVLLNILVPLYELNTDLLLTALAAADSGTLAVMPRLTFYAGGNLTIELSYSGIYEIYPYDGSEADLAPFNQAAGLSGRFSF